MTSPKCDACEMLAAWTVTAAYDDEGPDWQPHPFMRRYPMPMYRACSHHLSMLLARDEVAPGSTRQWVVRPIVEVK